MDSITLDASLTPLCDAPHWYVGFSGGLDSTVLLHLLAAWCARRPASPPLAAIHVNHGLADEGEDWAAQCTGFCEALRVPCRVRNVTVPDGASAEAQARSARYAAFEEEVGERDVLFLAHHLDDQVETFFLRLLRGAGLDGLAAMPARRPLGKGLLVRPLLRYTRRELTAYANEQGLDYVQDSSNADTRFDRNFLRTELLPLIEGRWPGYRATVSRAAEHAGIAASQLREQAGPLPLCESVLGDPGLELSALLARSDDQAAVTLRHALALWGRRAPDRVALTEFLRQLRQADEEASPELRVADFTLARFRNAVYLLPPEAAPARDISLGVGQTVELPGIGRLWLERAVGEGWELRSGEQLSLRTRRGGEQCRPRNRQASSLKKLLQQWDIPPWWRQRLPLVYAGDELLSVADLALCESSRLSGPQTGGERWKIVWQRPNSGPGD